MELRCRCHGLSGSCSLKTCWQTLPDFQLIGAYLRKKYDASVHLPSAVDVNKLIPMMDRAEISAILNGAGDQPTSEPTSTTEPLTASTNSTSQLDLLPAPEFAPLVAAPPATRIQLSGHFIMPPAAAAATTTITTTSTTPAPQVDLSAYAPLNGGPHYASYYDSFKQRVTPQAPTTTTSAATTSSTSTTASPSAVQTTSYPSYEAQTTGDQFQEIPAYNITPMTQQQYQALIRDMKLCNNHTATHLTTREIQQPLEVANAKHRLLMAKKGQQQPTALTVASNHHQQGQMIKSANQQLSHLLQHSNKEELVHLHKSPDYCEADLRHGFAGIQSRQCSENPLDPDNCDKLCCGRGYTKHIYRQKYDCDCKFQYCCSIWCSVCEREIKVVLCK